MNTSAGPVPVSPGTFIDENGMMVNGDSQVVNYFTLNYAMGVSPAIVIDFIIKIRYHKLLI